MSYKYFCTSVPSKYKARSCPLFRLDPQEIKKNLNDFIQSHPYFLDEKINNSKRDNYFLRSTYFNEVASILLGRKSSWQDYQKEYSEKLISFMRDNGLKYIADDDHLILESRGIKFSLRDVSDRLFLSGRPLPKAVFTGYGCKMDFIHQVFQHLPKEDPIEELNTYKPYLESLQYQEFLHKHNVDLLLPMTVETFSYMNNLIGDVFVNNDSEVDDQFMYQKYIAYQGLDEQTQYYEIQRYFHEMLLQLKKGWIEIIPYSEHLIFLKSNDGYYDFVFKNLRTEEYFSPYDEYIQFERIPKVLREEYDFERWQYFGYRGDDSKAKRIDLWKEKDWHEAEIAFYTSNELDNYPSIHEVMKQFYIKTDRYSRPTYKPTTKVLDAFQQIKAKNKTLCVSPLVSIKEFDDFLQENGCDYEKHRSGKLDLLDTVNCEHDTSLPVSVTWYDAIAYCRWLEDKYNIDGIRLIAPEEYSSICPKTHYCKDINEPSYYQYGNMVMTELRFFLNGQEFNPQECSTREFDTHVIMQWRNPPLFITNNGLSFGMNATFKEWSLERGITLSALYPDAEISHETRWKYFFAPHSNNKYKYNKIGFRVCYEMSGGVL